MIICHCSKITDHDIDAAINWMRAADPETLITPGKIYRALGKTPNCGGCMPLFLNLMSKNPCLGIDPPREQQKSKKDNAHTGRALRLPTS